MATRLINSIQINCSPDALYRYVTQPWHWHQWHPNSVSAETSANTLNAGDVFTEEIEIQPFLPLTLRMRRKTKYTVLITEPFQAWEVRGETSDGWLEIRYDLEPDAAITRFTRTLTFKTSGLSALLMPFLKRRMAQTSRVALLRLKEIMEKA